VLLRRRPERRSPSTSCSRRTSTGSSRISRRRSTACRRSARSASRRSTTAPSPTRPTARPIVGPAWGLKNFWLNEGHSASASPRPAAPAGSSPNGSSRASPIDMMGVDPRRFGPYATRGYLRTKNEEAYANVFTIHYPDEERVAARPLKQTPCYDRMKARGAVFGSSTAGSGRTGSRRKATPDRGDLAKPDVSSTRTTRRPPPAEPIREKWSFRRSNYFELRRQRVPARAREGRPARHVAFAKFRVSVPGAEAWLDSILANRIPKKVGRMRSATCCRNGGVRSRVHRLPRGPESFYLVSAGAMERHDHDYLTKLLPGDGSVAFAEDHHPDGRAGARRPAVAALLQKVTDADLSNAAFPWLTGSSSIVGWAPAMPARQFRRRARLGTAPPDRDAERHLRLLMEAGRRIRHQARSASAPWMAMRLEKSYR
jgi:dimethylglycine dehydrogenase